MARCAICGNKVGLLDKSIRRIDKKRHCPECLAKLYAERSAVVREEIFSTPSTSILMKAPVVCGDLDDSRNMNHIVGMLLFTNRGVLFVQQGEFLGSNGAQAGAQVGGILGALIGGLIGDSVNKKRHKKTRDEVDLMRTFDSKGIIDHAKQLVLFRLGDLEKVKADKRCFKLKSNGKMKIFVWEDKRVFQLYRPLLDAYVEAVNDRRDVLAECKPFM